MPDLNLIDPSNEFGSASAYEFSPSPLAAASGMGMGFMYASMGLSAISAITSAFQQSAAIKAQGAYEQAIANTNSSIATFKSQEALDQGDEEANARISKTRQIVGQEEGVQGGSGTDVASGSNVLVRLATSNAGAIDALTIKNNAQRQAFGYKVQAIQDTAAGKFSSLTADSKSKQALLTGGLQALEGPLSIESNYLRFSRYMGGGGGGGSNAPFPMTTG